MIHGFDVNSGVHKNIMTQSSEPLAKFIVFSELTPIKTLKKISLLVTYIV